MISVGFNCCTISCNFSDNTFFLSRLGVYPWRPLFFSLMFLSVCFSFCVLCNFVVEIVLKFLLVVNNDTSMHAVHFCTVALRQTVHDAWGFFLF